MNIDTQSTVHKKKSAKPTRDLKPMDAPASDETRYKMIAEAAYFLAQRSGFTGNHALEDWLESENQVNAMLTRANARR